MLVSNNKDGMNDEIIKNIEDGAFKLFSLFPTLESINSAIENNNTLLNDYLIARTVRRRALPQTMTSGDRQTRCMRYNWNRKDRIYS
jgi:hypothetical protein